MPWVDLAWAGGPGGPDPLASYVPEWVPLVQLRKHVTSRTCMGQLRTTGEASNGVGGKEGAEGLGGSIQPKHQLG